MTIKKFGPLYEALQDKSNLVMLSLGLIFLADLLFLDHIIIRQVVILQLKFMKIDPSRKVITIRTFFGIYRSVDAVGWLYDTILSSLFIGMPGLSFLRGLFDSLLRKV